MNQKLLSKMIARKRLILSRWQTFCHYSVVPFLLITPACTAYDLIKAYFFHSYVGRPIMEMMPMDLFFLFVAIFFYFIQWRRLRFSEYIIPHSEDDFEEALKRTIEEFDWTIVTHQKKFVQAMHPFNWVVSDGELVTIIKDGDRLLLNSICDPNRPSVISYGWNKKNIRTFLENLKAVIKQVPEKNTDLEIPEKEWTFKKILTRLILYPVCIILIVIGICFIVDKGLIALIPSLGCIAIASLNLYSDLRIITKNTTSTSEW